MERILTTVVVLIVWAWAQDAQALGLAGVQDSLAALSARLRSLETVQREQARHLQRLTETRAPLAPAVPADLADSVAALQRRLHAVAADLAGTLTRTGLQDVALDDLRRVVGEVRAAVAALEAPVAAPPAALPGTGAAPREALPVAPPAAADPAPPAAAALRAPRRSLPPVAVAATVSAVSHYVWRGYQVADRPTLQPSLTFSLAGTGLALNIWGSATLQGRQGARPLAEADELDVTLGYDRAVAWSHGSGRLSVAYVQYTFPRLDTDRHTEEVFCQAALDHPLAPRLAAAYDFGLSDAWYLAGAVGPRVPLDAAGHINLDLSLSLGFGNAARSFGFHDFTVMAALPVQLGFVSLTPAAGFSYADPAVLASKGSTWGGVTVGLSP